MNELMIVVFPTLGLPMKMTFDCLMPRSVDGKVADLILFWLLDLRSCVGPGGFRSASCYLIHAPPIIEIILSLYYITNINHY